MKIKRTTNGRTEHLASRPISVLAEDGVTVDHVEAAWTDVEAEAFDFTQAAPTTQHARDLRAQLAGFGAVEFPVEFDALPEPVPRAAPPAKVGPRVETKTTPEGEARRAAVAVLMLEATRHTEHVEEMVLGVEAMEETASVATTAADVDEVSSAAYEILESASTLASAAEATARAAEAIGASEPARKAEQAVRDANEAAARAAKAAEIAAKNAEQVAQKKED